MAADYHQQEDGSSQMPGQTEEAMPTALLEHHNGASRAEGQHLSNEDRVLHTNRTPPPSRSPVFFLSSREMGKLAALRLTIGQQAPKPQSAELKLGPTFTYLLYLSLQLRLALENHNRKAPEACGPVQLHSQNPIQGQEMAVPEFGHAAGESSCQQHGPLVVS